MLQILRRSRRHCHNHSRCLKEIRTDAYRIIPLFSRERCKYNRCKLPHILGLRSLCLHAEALGHVHGNCHQQKHIITVIQICLFIRLSLYVNFHQPGSSGQLFPVCGNPVELIGHIKIPRKRCLLLIQRTFIVKAFPAIRRKLPDHFPLSQLRFILS